MTRDDRFDHTLAAWLDERAAESRPRYLDEVLATTGRTRQRPAWSSLGRWLPIDALARPIALADTARLLVMLALLAAMAAAVLYVGSRPRLPAPFGPAGNGAIVYGSSGDLHAFDTGANVSRPIVLGETEDETPEFSHDGTRFVFARRADVPGRWILMVASGDGTDVRPLTGPIDPTWNVWSLDDTQVLVVDSAGLRALVALYNVDGRPPVVLNVDGQEPTDVAFLPSGREIVFRGTKAGAIGVYALGTAAGSVLRPIVAPVPGSTSISSLAISPDGRTLAYTDWAGDRSVVRLVDLASGEGRLVQLDPSSEGENVVAWSPEGKRLLFHRHVGGSVQLAVANIDGGAVALLGPTFAEGVGGAEAAFSPDGLAVIARYPTDGSVWLLDAAGGPGAPLDFDTGAAVSWQRIAP